MKLRWSLLLLVLIFCSILPTTLPVQPINIDVEGAIGNDYISEDAASEEAAEPAFNMESVGRAGSSDWPMFHHDLYHTGYSPSPAPIKGSLLWRYQTGNPVHSSPAIVNGKVFIGGGARYVYCLDEDTGSCIWATKIGGFVDYSSPAVADGKVFVGSLDDYVYCLDEETGSCIWAYKTGGDVNSSPAVVDGKVFVGSDDHYIYCLDEDTGSLVWKYITGWIVHSSPAVVDGKVFVGSQDYYVYCLDEDTGTLIWRYKTGGAVSPSPAVVDGKVFIGSGDDYVYCLDQSTGSLIWRYKTGGNLFYSSPAVADGKVFVGSEDDYVYCLDEDTGTRIWRYRTGGWIWSSPAVAGRKVFVGSLDDYVYCLDEETGSCIWAYKTGGNVDSSPAVADRKVFVGSGDGYVYCFGALALDFSMLKELFIHYGVFDALMVYGETQPHTLWGSRTIDVVGGTYMAMAFTNWATTVSPSVKLDIEVYNEESEEFLPAFRGPLIAIGGPCVNWAWWHYNHYIPHNPEPTSPLWAWFRWADYPTGWPEVYTSTGNSYKESWINADEYYSYAIVQVYWDPEYERPVLLVAGICGPATRAACEWLASWMLNDWILSEDCAAFVMRVRIHRDGTWSSVVIQEKIWPP